MIGHLSLLVAALLLVLAIWIVVPAPNMTLLVLGVGVPELSPLLLVASIGACALLALVTSGIERVTGCTAALVAAVLLSWPLLQLPGTIRRLDEALTAARIEAPDGPPAGMRRAPFSMRDALLGVDEGEARVTRGIAFATVGGEALSLDVYRPTASGRFPILVQIYGGAWQRGEPSNDAAFARYFASRGHVVFAIDYRHAPRWQWPAQIDDVRAALAWVHAHAGEHGGDAGRVVLVGRSAGAQLALMAAYTPSVLPVAGVVGFYGPTNLGEGWRVPPRPDPLPVRPTLEAYLGGTPNEVRDRYRAASALEHASAMAPPTLLVYGARDHIVEARFGRELHARLRQLGATSVLLEIPWAEHAFDAVPRGLGGQVSLYYVERFVAWALSERRPPR